MCFRTGVFSLISLCKDPLQKYKSWKFQFSAFLSRKQEKPGWFLFCQTYKKKKTMENSYYIKEQWLHVETNFNNDFCSFKSLILCCQMVLDQDGIEGTGFLSLAMSHLYLWRWLVLAGAVAWFLPWRTLCPESKRLITCS